MDAVKPTIGVLALQGDVREHVRMLRECGAEAMPVRRAAELNGIDGIVIPGGESTTMSKLAATLGLLEPLRDAVAAGLPAYGSCAGMIMLAGKLVDGTVDQQTIGGMDMLVRRNAFGRQVDSFEADLDIEGLDEPLHAVFIRAPWVESVGDEVRVLARIRNRSAGDSEGIKDIEPTVGVEGPEASERPVSHAADGMIVAARQGNLLATAFHPELTGDLRVHRLFLELVQDASATGRPWVVSPASATGI